MLQHDLHTDFLDRLTAIGAGRDDVDLVVCTHLRPDHVGWNIRLVDSERVPSFPNAS
jgi:glyoxylase-like metal-dependent hydrolase (beta-lactamase superfamily II)